MQLAVHRHGARLKRVTHAIISAQRVFTANSSFVHGGAASAKSSSDGAASAKSSSDGAIDVDADQDSQFSVPVMGHNLYNVRTNSLCVLRTYATKLALLVFACELFTQLCPLPARAYIYTSRAG